MQNSVGIIVVVEPAGDGEIMVGLLVIAQTPATQTVTQTPHVVNTGTFPRQRLAVGHVVLDSQTKCAKRLSFLGATLCGELKTVSKHLSRGCTHQVLII